MYQPRDEAPLSGVLLFKPNIDWSTALQALFDFARVLPHWRAPASLSCKPYSLNYTLVSIRAAGNKRPPRIGPVAARRSGLGAEAAELCCNHRQALADFQDLIGVEVVPTSGAV